MRWECSRVSVDVQVKRVMQYLLPWQQRIEKHSYEEALVLCLEAEACRDPFQSLPELDEDDGIPDKRWER